ncbi:hypothetical protein BG910_08950 [Neisseria chenwenguii]|uniref:Uncharacterized protein n=1 Tax=Neisseria chenwenguii TaxID=1853278 RepID=A0A220S376_9NEIS|nr:hypothetical protein BG910_08950 [Neisseria chenwenguii]
MKPFLTGVDGNNAADYRPIRAGIQGGGLEAAAGFSNGIRPSENAAGSGLGLVAVINFYRPYSFRL